ncbi:MAG: porin [Pseudomonadota bacterium]
MTAKGDELMKRMKLFLAALLFVALVPAAVLAETAGYDHGFYIKNDDGSFNLTINGRIQSKLFYNQQRGTPKQLSFQIRRAQMGVMAKYDDVVTAGFVLKHAVGNTAGTNFQTVNIANAIVALQVIPEFTVTAGMVGLPLDMMTEASSAWFLLTEAPITSTQSDGLKAITILRPSFGTPDGLGVNFSGGYWKWFYSASVVNGTETNYDINPDRKMSAGFRTGVNILEPVPGSMTDFECSSTPKLTISAGTDYQGKRVDPNTGANIKYLWTSSLGAGVRWGGFAFTSEGYYRKTKITTIGTAVWARPRLTDIGYYAAAGYYVLPKKLEIAGQTGQIFRQGPANDSWQFGGGLNYYVFDNNLKLQLAYTFTNDFNDVTGSVQRHIHNMALMASAIF